MPLFEMTDTLFRAVPKASFAEMKVQERGDLQRLLRTQIDVLDDDLYVLAEEFGDWEDSRRRIDILAIDKQANLVVIELKRTNDGGHMDLQAIRYASMVSAMTFARAEQIHGAFLRSVGVPSSEAQCRLLEFLDWDEPDEELFGEDVRIVLVSEDFDKELTTAVLWLRDRDIDIRCIRMRPYVDRGTRLIDVQQIIPLPEAAEYQIQLKEKEQVGRKERAERHSVRLRFWEGLVSIARSRNGRHASIKPNSSHFIEASSGYPGLRYTHSVKQEHSDVELYIDRGPGRGAENKSIFDALLSKKEAIEHSFGGELSWQRLDAKRACRIQKTITIGGWKSPESTWPQLHAHMIEAMNRLEAALKPHLEVLDL